MEQWEIRDLIEVKNDWKKLAQEQAEKVEELENKLNHFMNDAETKQGIIYKLQRKIELLDKENKSLAMKIISEEEFEILQHWGFIASTERPLSKKEAELYFKITDV